MRETLHSKRLQQFDQHGLRKDIALTESCGGQLDGRGSNFDHSTLATASAPRWILRTYPNFVLVIIGQIKRISCKQSWIYGIEFDGCLCHSFGV